MSSLATNPERRIEPLVFSGDADAAWKKAREAVESLPRTRVEESAPGYLHAVATSRLMRFKDDVELVLDAAGHKIDVRSSSRKGYSDMGVNRRRVEALRKLFSRP